MGDANGCRLFEVREKAPKHGRPTTLVSQLQTVMNNRNRPSEGPEVWPISANELRARCHLLSRFPYSIVHVVAHDGHSGGGALQAQARVLLRAFDGAEEIVEACPQARERGRRGGAVSRNTWLRVSGLH